MRNDLQTTVGEVNQKQKRARSSRLSLLNDAEKPCIRWWSGELMEVENHCGVLEFTQNCIRLYSKLGILRIEGRNMDIRLADCESVIIYGEICGLFYENLKNKG